MESSLLDGQNHGIRNKFNGDPDVVTHFAIPHPARHIPAAMRVEHDPSSASLIRPSFSCERAALGLVRIAHSHCTGRWGLLASRGENLNKDVAEIYFFILLRCATW